jgi:hypothetical protein
VKGLRIAWLHDPRVIAQAVEELRPIGLGVDRLKLVALDEGLVLGTVGFRIDVHALGTRPDTGHTGEWPKIGQRVGIRLGLGVDVSGVGIHMGSRLGTGVRDVSLQRPCNVRLSYRAATTGATLFDFLELRL